MGPIVVSVQLWLHLRDPQSRAVLYPLPLPLPLPLVALLPEDTCCAVTAHANSSTPPSRAILLTSIALRCFCQLRVRWLELDNVGKGHAPFFAQWCSRGVL